MSHERGGRPAKLPMARLSDHFPDPNRSRLADHLDRNRYVQSFMAAQHSTLTVGNTQTQTTTELQRVRSVQAGPVAGGTLTFQVYVDDRPIFDGSVRPVSGGGVMEPTDIYTIPAGSVVETIIEADSGVPAGTANVVIETEPYELRPRHEIVKLTGKNRLFASRRRRMEQANVGTDPEAPQDALAGPSGVVNRPTTNADGVTVGPTGIPYRRSDPPRRTPPRDGNPPPRPRPWPR